MEQRVCNHVVEIPVLRSLQGEKNEGLVDRLTCNRQKWNRSHLYLCHESRHDDDDDDNRYSSQAIL